MVPPAILRISLQYVNAHAKRRAWQYLRGHGHRVVDLHVDGCGSEGCCPFATGGGEGCRDVGYAADGSLSLACVERPAWPVWPRRPSRAARRGIRDHANRGSAQKAVECSGTSNCSRKRTPGRLQQQPPCGASPAAERKLQRSRSEPPATRGTVSPNWNEHGHPFITDTDASTESAEQRV